MYFDKISSFVRLSLDVLDDPLFAPLVNEKLEAKSIKLAIPGHGKDDVRVTYCDGKLTVYLKDKPYRAFHVPSGVDLDSIDITVENGMLDIDLSKNAGTETELKIK